MNVSYEAFYIFKKIYAGKIFQNALKNRKKSKGQSFLWAHQQFSFHNYSVIFVIESKYDFKGKIKDKAISSSIPNAFDFSKMPIMILN